MDKIKAKSPTQTREQKPHKPQPPEQAVQAPEALAQTAAEAVRLLRRAGAAETPPLKPEHILALQRTAGNSAVQTLLAGRYPVAAKNSEAARHASRSSAMGRGASGQTTGASGHLARHRIRAAAKPEGPAPASRGGHTGALVEPREGLVTDAVSPAWSSSCAPKDLPQRSGIVQTAPVSGQPNDREKRMETATTALGLTDDVLGTLSIALSARRAIKEGKYTSADIRENALKVMEKTGKGVLGTAGAALATVKLVGKTAVEEAMKKVNEVFAAIKSAWNSLVSAIKALASQKKKARWETLTAIGDSVLNLAKSVASSAQSIMKFRGVREIPILGPVLDFIDGVWSAAKTIRDWVKLHKKIQQSNQLTESTESGLLHKDKPTFQEKVKSVFGKSLSRLGRRTEAEIADNVREMQPQRLPTDPARKNLQVLKEWALDFHLVEIGRKRERKGVYAAVGKAVDIVKQVVSIAGAIAAFGADVFAFGAGKLVKLATKVATAAIGLGQTIVSAAHGFGLKLRQWGRDLAAKGKLGKLGRKVFNIEKSTEKKKMRRLEDATTLMKTLADTPELDRLEHIPRRQWSMEHLRPAWARADRRLSMTGVDKKKLADCGDELPEAIALVAEAMGGRELSSPEKTESGGE